MQRIYFFQFSTCHQQSFQIALFKQTSLRKSYTGVRINQTVKVAEKLLPITKVILHEIIGEVLFCTPDHYSCAMLKALLLFAHYACLRVGYLVWNAKAENVSQTPNIHDR